MAHEWERDKISNISVWRCVNCNAMTCFGYKATPDSRVATRYMSSKLQPKTGMMLSCDEIIAFTVQGS